MPKVKGREKKKAGRPQLITEEQLRDLIGIANKFGFYDAADALKNLLALK